MLVLFETPAGYAIFKLLDAKKLKQSDNLYVEFETPENASKVVKLKHFEKFTDTTEALAATTAAVEGKLAKTLKRALKKFVDKDVQDQLLVADSKLGNAIKDKLNLQCVSNTAVHELVRCIRSQAESLLSGLPKKEITAMALGLAHSLSRYKLKFSPDKIDTMIIQAVSLLDDLDKELNNYNMRCREWYGWHFPELGKILTDNIVFVKTIKIIGTRDNTSVSDLSDILPEEIEEQVKEAAEISMGTEISIEDIMSIQNLCDQIIEITNYRTQLYDYLKARMMAMAPNLTVLVGELIGARLISHAGSLINLAKHPASTVQILGAEKALFRALKTKKDTPKYGLIYHAQLIGKSSNRNKGKMSRMLAAKAALATRVDALGEDVNFDLGAEHKAKLEARLRILEEGNLKRISGTGKVKAKFEKYQGISEIKQYPAAADSTLPSGKRKRSESEIDIKQEVEDDTTETPKQKKKKRKKMTAEEDESSQITIKQEITEDDDDQAEGKKKKTKRQHEEVEIKVEIPEASPGKKKKKKKSLSETVESVEEQPVEGAAKKKKRTSLSESAVSVEEQAVSKKKKKKNKNTEEQE